MLLDASESPAWSRRLEGAPTTLQELLEWLDRVAKPHLLVIQPDRCLVSLCSNTGRIFDDVFKADEIARHSELLCDEVRRAHLLLSSKGRHNLPDYPSITNDPHKAEKHHEDFRRWLIDRIENESKLANGFGAAAGGQTDSESDRKQKKKKRVFSDAARACARAYRRALESGERKNRKLFCQDWTAESGHKYRHTNGKPPSWKTIDRALQDHPDEWNPSPDTADKSADTVV